MAATISTIEDWIKDQMEDDSTLLTAIGGTSSTTRVYYWHPPVEAWNLIDESQGAIISYRMGAGGAQGGVEIVWAVQKPDEIGIIDIYSYVKTTLESAFNRIDALFDEQLQADITDWKVRRIHRTNKQDIYGNDSHIYHRHLEYRFHGLLDAS